MKGRLCTIFKVSVNCKQLVLLTAFSSKLFYNFKTEQKMSDDDIEFLKEIESGGKKRRISASFSIVKDILEDLIRNVVPETKQKVHRIKIQVQHEVSQ